MDDANALAQSDVGPVMSVVPIETQKQVSKLTSASVDIDPVLR